MASAGIQASVSGPLPEATAAIRLLARLARVAEQTCQTEGVSLPQYRLLVSVSGQPQRPSELAASVGVSRPTLTSLVDGLEQAGLLKRVPVATDRRGISLEVTADGREAMMRTERALIRRIAQLMDGDADVVMGSVKSAIEGLVEALDREREALLNG